MCTAASVSELFCMAHLANNERFLYHSKLSFEISSFMYIAANASELFCMAYLANIERFLYHSKLSF